MERGWIKLHRQITEWEWYKDNNTKSLFLHLLIEATKEPRRLLGYTLKSGQLITTVNKLSDQTGLSVRQVRVSLDKLVKSQNIDKQTTNKFTVITIVNYTFFQNQKNSDVEIVTNKRQTNDKQMTRLKQEVKNIRIKEDKNKEREESGQAAPLTHSSKKYGEYENVLLTDEEYEKIKNEYSDYEKRIERLSEYIASTGKVYKSHYATIRAWAKKDKEEKEDGKKEKFTAYQQGSYDHDKLENIIHKRFMEGKR